MKIAKSLSFAVLSLFFLQVSAQTDAPKGFSRGNVVLPDNTVVSGYIKDNIRKDASVILLSNGKEKNYDGADISGAEVDATSYICIKGDFFKVVCKGELCFLQKSSNASSKPTYVGNEVLFISGTEGKTGDYFIYNGKDRQLQLVTKRTFETVVSSSFGSYAPAMEKAKAAQGNIAELKDAVELFNKRNG